MVRQIGRAGARKSRSVAAAIASWFAASSVLTSCTSTITGRTHPQATSPARPNIVFVLTDDQRVDQLGQMPIVTRRLLPFGMELDRAYVVNALCSPSRTSLLTGQYSHSSGIYLNGDRARLGGGFEDFDDRSTIAVWLHSAGYRTGMFGKYLNHYHDGDYVPPGWDRWVALLAPNSLYYQYDLAVDGSQVRYFGSRPSDYSTDVYARYAGAFIRHAPADQPVFVWVAPAAPHGPNTPPVRYEHAYPRLTAHHSPNFNEADVSDKPAYIRRVPRLTQGKVNAMDVRARQSARTLRAVDDLVGTLLIALHDTRRLANTLFVLMSDNGAASGEHAWRYKLDPYEESIRVPMVVRWDGVVRGGSTSHRLVANIDIPPTFASVAGARSPSVDGVSIMPVLKNEGSVRTNFLIEHQHFGARYDPPTYCAVRSGSWLFVHYKTGEEELYDLRNDPYELDNRRLDPALTERVTELRALDRQLCVPRPPHMPPF
jgi:N-acetylglucosamine-6-sulfatase